MERLTSDNAFEMSMTELALNQVFVRDGWAWYRKGPEEECSVCDLIRSAAYRGLWQNQIDLAPDLTDTDLGDVMFDWLQFGEEEPEGILAILYRALWAMAEVRERLKKYEDTGLGPDEITTEPYGCAFYCNRRCNLDGDWCAEGPGCQQEIDSETAKHLLELSQAEKDGRLVVLPPNDPLTLRQLREMDGEPVWCARWGVWGLVDIGFAAVITRKGDLDINDEVIHERLYRRKPEAAHGG